MRITTPCLVASLAIILAAPSVATEPATRPLRVAGSTTLFPVAEGWVEGFRDRYPDSPVELAAGGTTAGLAAVLDGGVDLALASRPLRAAEEAHAAELGLRLERFEVARDALSVVVHARNPVAALSGDQLRGLFTGELGSWDAVGGPAQPVTVVTRNPSSYTGRFFRQQILDDLPFSTASEVVSNRAEMIARVAARSWAIGFAGLADALNSQDRKQVKLVKLFLDDTDPAVADTDPAVEESQKRGHSAYAISRPLFFFARAPISPAVEQFVTFVLSPEGQELIVSSNFFRLDPS